MTTVERVRAGLVSASDLYGVGRPAPARRHLARAETIYAAQLGRGTRARDRLLYREIVAAFAVVDMGMREREQLIVVRDRLGLLSGQLLDGSEELLVPAAARNDAGARALVLSDTLAEMQGTYAAGLADGDAFAVEHAYGLLVRAQSQARGLAPSLGEQREAVIEALSTLRTRAFPLGIMRPPSAAPASEMSARTERIRGALEERYRL